MRKAQIDAFVRLVPATVAIQILTAAVMVVGLRDTTDHFQLGLWFSAALLLCFMRGVRAVRLRNDREYAERYPPRTETICLLIAVLASLWLVPPLYWFDQAEPPEQIFMCVTMAALVSAGSITLVSLPQAAVLYVGLLTIGCATLTLKLDSPWMFGLVIVYAAVLMIERAQHGAPVHQAIAATGFELREQGEIIQLLREIRGDRFGRAVGARWRPQHRQNVARAAVSDAIAGRAGDRSPLQRTARSRRTDSNPVDRDARPVS